MQGIQLAENLLDSQHGPWPIELVLKFSVSQIYVGGPKRNRKRSLVGGPIVVHASAAKFLLRGPFCISLPTGIVERSRGAT